MGVLAMVGPTASGKSEAAIVLAPTMDAEIVSVDSMLVYRGMDIGTAKPTSAQRAAVPHHLIDVAEPSEPFSVARFQRLARAAIAGVTDRDRAAFLVGGSGLYFRAAVDDLEFPGTDETTRADLEREADEVGAATLHGRLASSDPTAAAKIEPGNVRRTVRALEVAAITGRSFSSFAAGWERYPPDRVRAVGLELERSVLLARIRARVGSMMDGGLIEEVRALLDRGFGGWLTATQAIGYAEIAGHLEGATSLEEAVNGTIRRTKNLARRQMAWFRRDPRIRWVRAGTGGALDVLEQLRAELGVG